MDQNLKPLTYVLHECESLPTKTVHVVYIRFPSNAEHRRWWLHQFREAEQKHIENGIADQIGVLLEDHWLEISHCPFCGVSLYKEARD